LEEVLSEKLTSWCGLFDKTAAPQQRRRSFRTWPWWKHHVEAMYRGELRRARLHAVKGPSDQAELKVAQALRVSQSAVHAVCGEIRALRQMNPALENYPEMVVDDYEQWMEIGAFPESLQEHEFTEQQAELCS
jgi:hypothetical protein